MPWSPNDMHLEEVKRTQGVVEGQWRFNAGVCLHLCLIGYTDQSGIGLWQHLTLTVLLCALCSKFSNINTHLCDLAVHLLYLQKVSVKQKSVFFLMLCRMYFLERQCSVMRKSLYICFMFWLGSDVYEFDTDSEIWVITPAAMFCFKTKCFMLPLPQSSLCKCKCDHWQRELARITKTVLWISSHTNGLSFHISVTIKAVFVYVW